MANYTLIDVVNGTDFQGASAYSTNSTGKLSFWEARNAISCIKTISNNCLIFMSLSFVDSKLNLSWLAVQVFAFPVFCASLVQSFV